MSPSAMPSYMQEYLAAICKSTQSDMGEIWKVSGPDSELDFNLVSKFNHEATALWTHQLLTRLGGDASQPNVLSELVLNTVRTSKDIFWANTSDDGGLIPGVGVIVGTLVGAPIYVMPSAIYIVLLYAEKNKESSEESNKLLQQFKIENVLPSGLGAALAFRTRESQEMNAVDADILSVLANSGEDNDNILRSQLYQRQPHERQASKISVSLQLDDQQLYPGIPSNGLVNPHAFPDSSRLEEMMQYMHARPPFPALFSYPPPSSHEAPPTTADHASQLLQSVAPPNPDAATLCRVKSCKEAAVQNTSHCPYHSGNRKCQHAGCLKCAQGGTKYCISHGGGRRCKYEGCNKGARDKFFCAAHGGGKRCQIDDCSKAAVGSSNLCTQHGGGRRCHTPGCSKSAQSSTDFCVRHGGGRRCGKDGCLKVARGRTKFCAAHGGGLRCSLTGCNRIAVSTKKHYCRAHLNQQINLQQGNGSVAPSLSDDEQTTKTHTAAFSVLLPPNADGVATTSLGVGPSAELSLQLAAAASSSSSIAPSDDIVSFKGSMGSAGNKRVRVEGAAVTTF